MGSRWGGKVYDICGKFWGWGREAHPIWSNIRCFRISAWNNKRLSPWLCSSRFRNFCFRSGELCVCQLIVSTKAGQIGANLTQVITKPDTSPSKPTPQSPFAYSLLFLFRLFNKEAFAHCRNFLIPIVVRSTEITRWITTAVVNKTNTRTEQTRFRRKPINTRTGRQWTNL